MNEAEKTLDRLFDEEWFPAEGAVVTRGIDDTIVVWTAAKEIYFISDQGYVTRHFTKGGPERVII